MTIFEIFNEINKKNTNYPKEFNSWVTYNWMVSTPDEYQLLFLANINNYINIPGKMFYRLLCCSVNKKVQYKWIHPKKQIDIKTKIISEYLGCSQREAKLHDFTKQDVLEMAEQLGYQKNDIKL